MKNKLLVLTVLTMMTLPIYSQNVSAPSSKPTQCVVPCEALRNALLVLEEKKLLENQLCVARDSIQILSSVIKSQNELVDNKTQQINLFKKLNSRRGNGILSCQLRCQRL